MSATTVTSMCRGGGSLASVGAGLIVGLQLAVPAPAWSAEDAHGGGGPELLWQAGHLVLVVGLLPGTLDLPQWIRNISPFTHIPALPAASFDIVPVLILAAVALRLTALGMQAVRRRDIG